MKRFDQSLLDTLAARAASAVRRRANHNVHPTLDAPVQRFFNALEPGAELPVDTWHTLVALQPSILFELKEGPYHALSDKDFAAWAPAEGDPDCDDFVAWYSSALPGALPPMRRFS